MTPAIEEFVLEACQQGGFDSLDEARAFVMRVAEEAAREERERCETAIREGETVDLESAERWISDALDEGSADAAWMFVRSGRALIARVRVLEAALRRVAQSRNVNCDQNHRRDGCDCVGDAVRAALDGGKEPK